MTTLRTPSTQFLLLNSADRFQRGRDYNTGVNNGLLSASLAPTTTDITPWNNFNLSKDQALLYAKLKRVSVSAIRFPNFITNVNAYNNTFYLIISDGQGFINAAFTPLTGQQPVKVTVPIGFYNPTSLVVAVNAAMILAYTNAESADFAANGCPIFQYGSNGPSTTGCPTYSFLPNANIALPFTTLLKPMFPFVVSWCPGTLASFMGPTDPFSKPYTFTHDKGHSFNSSANFFNLIGMSEAASGLFVSFTTQNNGNNLYIASSPPFLQGDITETIYSPYYDICCPELHFHSKQRDGTSAKKSASNNVLCRVFVADEISVANYIGAGTYSAIGQTPSVIHRQFVSPKQIEFSPDASIGSVSIQVLDAWGNLVPLPPANQPWNNASYPDFQITLACSE